MKTNVNHAGNQIKIALDFAGKVTVTLPGGKQAEGQCTEEELEVIAYRVSQISKGAIFFEPEPNDFFAMHHNDVETLEKQSEALHNIRVEMEETQLLGVELVKEKSDLQARLTACEIDLVEARGNLKDSRQAISLLQEKIEYLETPKSYVAELSGPETVHNERSEAGDTEPPTASISTVHNERPTEQSMPLL